MKSNQDPKEKTHDYHFKLDAAACLRLREAFPGDSGRGVSALAVRVLKMLYVYIEKEHFSGGEKGTHYKLISSDLDDQRVSVHAHIPLWLYRRLKLVHHNLNFYSMAQFVRGIIHIFLNLKERLGDKLEEFLVKVRHGVEKLKARAKRRGVPIREVMPPPKWCGKVVIFKSFYDDFFAPRKILIC